MPKKTLFSLGLLEKKEDFHPFKDMKVEELRVELTARGKSDEGNKEDLEKRLSELLGGTTRLPALLHSNENFDVSVKELNIESYEVLFFEALHCSMNHIKNVLQELPHHITDIDTLIKLKEILAVQMSKDKLRGVDYRKTLIYITIALYQFANREVKLLLVTLCEMIEIYYAQEEYRSPKMILRLHNLCWRHAIQCRRVLTPPKKLTYRKLFGLYFHSCVTHSAQLLRLASHRSTNAEMFERLFEKLSDITTKTWSKRIEDLSTNAILHLQAEKSNPVNNCILKEEREISKMAKSLPKLDNTTLLKSELEKYAGDWVAHLQLISDFLKPGEGVWWKEVDDSIEFFDGPDEPSFREEGPKLHHFRSTSIAKEQELLDACWNECLVGKVKLPATKLRDDSGKWQRSPTCCSFESAMEGNSSEELVSDSAENLNQEHELAEELDYAGDREEADAGTWPLQTQTNCETMSMEVDLFQEHGEKTGIENLQWSEAEILPQPNGNKRAIASCTEEESSSQEPPAKRKKTPSTDSEVTVQLLSKTAKAIEQVLGTCEEVVKYDKLKQSATKNPKSRYHMERYETHLTKIPILTLKKYKQLYNDLKENPQDASKTKQIKSASALLKLWKITLHLV